MSNLNQRKIVSFQGVADENGGNLYVLCDDGTMWMCHSQSVADPSKWMRILLPMNIFNQPALNPIETEVSKPAEIALAPVPEVEPAASEDASTVASVSKKRRTKS